MTAATPPADSADAAHCAELLHRGDRDRWLTALFAPEGARRDALMALYAWNLEVARIPDTVSEGIIGQMRLQWWRETVEGIYADTPRAQPIARALHRAVRLGGLPASAFEAMLEARERDVAAEAPADMAALERYVADTAGQLSALAAQCLDAAEAAPAAAAAGNAYGLAGLIKALPWHAERGRVYLPVAELRANGVVADNVVHRANPPGLYTVIAAVAERAAAQLDASRTALAALPPGLRRRALPAMLPAALAAQDLARLRAARFDPERPRAHASPLRRQLRLLRSGLLRRP
ncbi:phytoene/squalene synthase family protein [Marinibaculum pumilum]|uniref:Phytoene/squalene synthase family protein n=1 Tax=Marinibaculum pumilum TaxID=1766165 RepID=A0ABV7KWK7_9PROT